MIDLQVSHRYIAPLLFAAIFKHPGRIDRLADAPSKPNFTLSPIQTSWRIKIPPPRCYPGNAVGSL